jgi:hypothetical protein
MQLHRPFPCAIRFATLGADCRVSMHPGKFWKVMELEYNFFQAWKVMEMRVGQKSHAKVMEFSREVVQNFCNLKKIYV